MNLEATSYLNFLLNLRKYLKETPSAHVVEHSRKHTKPTLRIVLEDEKVDRFRRAYDPITFTVLHEQHFYLHSSRYQEATVYLQIDIPTIQCIVDAADGKDGRYRKHLEYFMGVTS